MSITTEQQLIKVYYNDENTTKTINDLIQDVKTLINNTFTSDEIKTKIKLDYNNITDWSI
tara:strand:- start:574 stop:753 length:180 start_codon:yes stop_codon:yes gene_type:complete